MVVTDCPQCDSVILGATAADWRRHFREECDPLGELYNFIQSNHE